MDLQVEAMSLSCTSAPRSRGCGHKVSARSLTPGATSAADAAAVTPYVPLCGLQPADCLAH